MTTAVNMQQESKTQLLPITSSELPTCFCKYTFPKDNIICIHFHAAINVLGRGYNKSDLNSSISFSLCMETVMLCMSSNQLGRACEAFMSSIITATF